MCLAGTGLALQPAVAQNEKPKSPDTAGMPPAFGTAPPVGPAVSPETFAEAEKLIRFELTPEERAQAAKNWQNSMAPLYERRTGPRKVEIPDSVAPASTWMPATAVHAAIPKT